MCFCVSGLPHLTCPIPMWNTWNSVHTVEYIHSWIACKRHTCIQANMQACKRSNMRRNTLTFIPHTNKHICSWVLMHSHARMHYVCTFTLRKIASYIYIWWHCIIKYNYRDGLTGADGWRQQLACPLQHHPPQVPLRARGLQPPIKRSWKRI